MLRVQGCLSDPQVAWFWSTSSRAIAATFPQEPRGLFTPLPWVGLWIRAMMFYLYSVLLCLKSDTERHWDSLNVNTLFLPRFHLFHSSSTSQEWLKKRRYGVLVKWFFLGAVKLFREVVTPLFRPLYLCSFLNLYTFFSIFQVLEQWYPKGKIRIWQGHLESSV